ncbi:BON1-like protein, partial [Mya arenaria]
ASNGTPEQTMSLHDVSENKSAISRYKKAMKHLRMSGPTRLKPVISFAESLAVREPTQDSQVYHVLLVIADGILNDIDDILERLTSISQLPLTFVFAGECFSKDSTGFVGLKNRTTSLSRKHTHFVSFPRKN